MLFVFLLFFCCYQISFAQKAIVKINPFNPIFGRYTVGAEVAITEHSSLSLFVSRSQVNYNSLKFQLANGTKIGGELNLSSWGFMPEYRYYFSKQALNGFFVGAFANYARMKADVSISGGTESTTGGVNTEFNNFGLGILTGYNFIIKEHFSIDAFVGLGGFFYDISNVTIRYKNDDVVTQNIPIPITAPLPRIGVNLGYAF